MFHPLNRNSKMQKGSSSQQFTESEDTSEESSFTNLSLKNVLGPFIYTKSIPEHCLQSLSLKTIQVFIPINKITEDLSKIKNINITGYNVYTVNSSLTGILLHQGVLYQKDLKPGSKEIGGYKVLNIYDDNYSLTNQESVEVNLKKDSSFVGFNLILTILPEVKKFDTVKSFEFKSHSSKTPGYGLLFVYGEPTLIVPENALDISSIECVSYISQPLYAYEDVRWCCFSLSNEPVMVYDIRNFIDYDKPYDQWLTQKLKRATLFFDTSDKRYELSSTSGGILFKLCLLKPNSPSLSVIRSSEGTPVKESLKTVIADSINWNNIKWTEKSVVINGTEYGPISGVFWIKRRRIL